MSRQKNSKLIYFLLFFSVTWRFKLSNRDNICLRKFCNLYLRNSNPQTRNLHEQIMVSSSN